MEIVWSIVVGTAVGWVAGVVMKGGALGIVGDIVVGIVGAVAGGFLFGALGVTASGQIGAIVLAGVGAVLLLVFVRLLRRV
ncbi:hypothetical protein BURK1_03243 [Burkholderiales bacterium]|nr:hypothetical protein BURK1_03243 [Burkholderiales bacterium]